MITISGKAFETTKLPMIIEVMSYSGSAFGLTENGEQVFVNQRIVSTMELSEGQLVMGHLMPNYPDKKDNVPWRAIRVELMPEAGAVAETETMDQDPVADEKTLSSKIYDLLKTCPEEYFTTADVAETVGVSVQEAGNNCLSLHRRGLIARAEVHSGPDQKRASFTLWAINSKTFAS